MLDNKLIFEAYRDYCEQESESLEQCGAFEDFVNKCENNSEFIQKCGLEIIKKELSPEERYNIWFNNNYETGMERLFDPNDIPNFEDEYYEPTPKKVTIINYKCKISKIFD